MTQNIIKPLAPSIGQFWMENKAEVSSDIVLSSARTVIFNINWDGYFIVNYDTKKWDMIAEVLIQDHTRISVQNRAQILHDVMAMRMMKNIESFIVKNIYDYLKKDTEYLPWKVALTNGISFIKNTKSSAPWILSQISPVLNDLGYSTREQDKPDQISLRVELLKIACELGDQKCRTEAQEKFKLWKESKDPNGKIPIDPNYQSTFIGIGILSGKSSAEIEENM
jgi:aminopeptidase N